MSPIPKLVSLLALTPVIYASILEKPVWSSDLKLDSSAAKVFPKFYPDDNDDTPLPLVIWHGLGDNYKAEGLASVAQLAENTNPGTFTYIIRLDEDAGNDRTATFFGNVTLQLEKVCHDLATHPILSTAPAIDALGFSQGGQFLRGYIERCNFPPVRSLVTFGSQHNGISQFQTCAATDFLCKGSESLLRSNTFSSFVQSRLVPAQYFRDPEEGKYEQYLEGSNFLADINNERELKNQKYKENLASLERFTMFVFEDDETVVPKESGWWSEVNGTEVIPLKERQLYKEDWLGLKKLDEEGKLRFESTKGKHMSLSEGLLERVFRDNFGVFGRPFEVEKEGAATSGTKFEKILSFGRKYTQQEDYLKDVYQKQLEGLEKENRERLREANEEQDRWNEKMREMAMPAVALQKQDEASAFPGVRLEKNPQFSPRIKAFMELRDAEQKRLGKEKNLIKIWEASEEYHFIMGDKVKIQGAREHVVAIQREKDSLREEIEGSLKIGTADQEPRALEREDL